MNRNHRLEWRGLAELRPGRRNPRQHPPEQVARIAASLRRYGWMRPLLIEPTGEIVVGEATWRAAGTLGHDRAPVVVVDHLTPAEIETYRVADNRLALDASWDEAQLAELFRDMQAAELDLTSTGFTDDEIGAVLEPDLGDDVAADRAVPPPAEPVTRPGDVWQLGPHRLVCGDSTSAATLHRLFGDDGSADLVVTDPPYGMAYGGGRAKRPRMVFTDPPYGMSFGAGREAGSTPIGATVKAHGRILGDDVRGEDLVQLVAGAMANAKAFARDRAAFYVCLTWRTYVEFAAAMGRAGIEIDACIVWDKGSIGLGWQHYRPQHEFIFYSAGEAFHGGKVEGDVWELTRGATGEYVHPTQKPVALIERALPNSSRIGELVLDVFGGSGSTLIAAERTGRVARLVELDPKYCDAIVRRWEGFTRRKAERVA